MRLMTSRLVANDLDFRGKATVRNMRPPVEPDEGATRGFVLDRLAELPLDQSDPGDITLIFENGLV